MRISQTFLRIYTSIENLWIKIILAVFKKDKSSESSSYVDGLRRIFRFLVWGCTNTLISYAVYALVLALTSSYFWASLISFIGNVSLNYLVNNSLIFKKVRGASYTAQKSALKTALGYSFSYLVQLGLLHFWIDIVGVNPFIGPILNTFIIVPMNYLLNRFWIYR